MDWIKKESAEVAKGSHTSWGHLTYRIGNDGLDGAPFYAEFSGHFVFSDPIYRGQSLEEARAAAEKHNRVWSNPL